MLPAKAALQDVVTVTFGGHHVTFSLRGALPVDWRVTVGQEKGQEHALPEVLFEPSASADSTGRFFGIDLPGRKEKGLANPDNVRYRFRKIANQGSVELRFSAPAAEDGLAVVKSFFLYEDHFRARYVLELSNRGTASLTLGNNEAGPGIALASTLGDKVSAALWRGRPVNISDDGIEGLDLDEDTPASVLQPVPVGWSGIESRYLLLALQPQQGTDSFDRIEAAIAGPRNEQVDFDAQPISTILRLPSATLAVGSSRRFEFAVYAGPKSKSAFADDAVLGQSLFGDLWNWMRWLCLALAWLLDLVHAAIPSWGLSLVALALLMRVILLPVTVKAQVHQSRTMIDQARLKPMLARIESEHAEDLEARNAATQKLYADEGLSMLAPLTGCLWVFLQIPIFIALYFVIGESYSLSGSAFLWIADLAKADHLFAWGLDVPYFGAHLNALPFLMAIAQVAATGTGQAAGVDSAQLASQRKAMMWMAFGFFILLYNFPAGLMLYWLVSNILQSLQQIALKGWVGKRLANTA